MKQQQNYLNNPLALFVGDLSFFCIEENLYDLFSGCGRVVNVEIKRGKATGDSLMHGFVEMDSDQALDSAINTLNGQKFMGRKIRVSRGTNPLKEIDPIKEGWVQLHVSFVTRQLEKRIDEEVLDSIFSAFGDIADVTVKRHKLVKEPKSQSGYGFVFFFDTEAAMKAVYIMKHTNIDGVTYDCSLSYKSEQKLNLKVPGQKPNEANTNSAPNPQNSSVSPNPLPQHFPAPPVAGVAVYPSQFSPANNPYPTTQSSYVRNPPTPPATITTASQLPQPPPHPHHPPRGLYIAHRQMDPYTRGYEAMPPAMPPNMPPFDQNFPGHQTSPQIQMQTLSPYNLGILNYPQSIPAIAINTPPQYSAISFSPQQSYSPQFSLYPVSPSPNYENYSGMPQVGLPAFQSFIPDPRLQQQSNISRNNRSRHRQQSLRRVEDFSYRGENRARPKSPPQDGADK